MKRKLEIGAGLNPQKPKEEWVHQDIRKLDGIDIVCNCNKLPFEDGYLNEVFSSHVIEHVGWRNVKAVLVEWLRVLEPNGRLEIITPDFYRLWSNLILKTELPKSDKWKGGQVDSAFVAYVTGGGQDYLENTHTAHFTPKWYTDTLEELGCKVQVLFHGKQHPSPSIRLIAFKGDK